MPLIFLYTKNPVSISVGESICECVHFCNCIFVGNAADTKITLLNYTDTKITLLNYTDTKITRAQMCHINSQKKYKRRKGGLGTLSISSIHVICAKFVTVFVLSNSYLFIKIFHYLILK